MRFVDRTSAFDTEGDRQFLAALVHLSELLRGASNDTDLVLWKKEIEGSSSATDLAAGQAVAGCLRVYLCQCKACQQGYYFFVPS